MPEFLKEDVIKIFIFYKINSNVNNCICIRTLVLNIAYCDIIFIGKIKYIICLILRVKGVWMYVCVFFSFFGSGRGGIRTNSAKIIN